MGMMTKSRYLTVKIEEKLETYMMEIDQFNEEEQQAIIIILLASFENMLVIHLQKSSPRKNQEVR